MNGRSDYADLTVLSETGDAKVVLIVDNWNFDRNLTQKDEKKIVACKSADCNVTIKISHPTFKKKTLTNDAPASNPFDFDRNGICMPFAAFVSLMNDKNFAQYMVSVKARFEAEQGKGASVAEQVAESSPDFEPAAEAVPANSSIAADAVSELTEIYDVPILIGDDVDDNDDEADNSEDEPLSKFVRDNWTASEDDPTTSRPNVLKPASRSTGRGTGGGRGGRTPKQK